MAKNSISMASKSSARRIAAACSQSMAHQLAAWQYQRMKAAA